MESKIKVLIVEPGKEPYVKEIGSDLESLRAEVGGRIEAVGLDGDYIILDEEGKLKRYTPNTSVRGKSGKVLDVLVGTFIIAGISGEDFGSLSDESIERWSEVFGTSEGLGELGDGRTVERLPLPVPEHTEEEKRLADIIKLGNEICKDCEDDCANCYGYGEFIKEAKHLISHGVRLEGEEK